LVGAKHPANITKPLTGVLPFGQYPSITFIKDLSASITADLTCLDLMLLAVEISDVKC